MCGILNGGDKCHASACEVGSCAKPLATAKGKFAATQETSPCELGGSVKRCVEGDGEVTSNRRELLEHREGDGLFRITFALSMEALDAANDPTHRFRLAGCKW